MEIQHLDLLKIILKGLSNSPNYLESHFKRSFKPYLDSGFQIEEILDNTYEVVALFKSEYSRKNELKSIATPLFGCTIPALLTINDKTFEKLKIALDAIKITKSIAEKSNEKDLTMNWKDLIRPEFHARLDEIENKMKDKINSWRQGEVKIECAAFCQLLFDNKYFTNGCTKRKSVEQFASIKYGNAIKNQLLSTHKEDRNTHKTLLKKYFL